MRVKIYNTWYDSSAIPICIELTHTDRMYINTMPKDAKKYAAAPDDAFISEEEFLDWMKE